MELIKKRVHMNRCNCRKDMQITLDNDFNVPDVSADIHTIVKEQGEVQVDEVRFVSGKGTIRGKLSFCILYVGDEEGKPVCQFKNTIPFEENVSLDDTCSEDDVSVKCLIDDLKSEMINSRKIGVKAILSFEIVSEALYDGEGAVDMEGNEEIFLQKKALPVTQLSLCKKDVFRMRDEFSLPSTKDSVERVLYESITLEEMETRLVENKINIGGQVKIFVLYISGTENSHLEFYETTLPIRGTLDCNGCDESMVPYIEIGIHSKDLEAKEDEDGEMRVFDLEMVLDLLIKVYREEELEVLTDFYARDRDLSPVFTDSYFEHLLMKNNSKARVAEKISLEENQKILQIWNVEGEIRIDEKKVVAEGILVQGVIETNILYVSGEGDLPIGSLKGTIPFEQTVDVKGMSANAIFELSGAIDQIGAVILREREVEVKATIELDVIAFEKIVLPMISDYSEIELDMETVSKEPGMVGYVVKENESLWDIAKLFRTKIETIVELNELETEEIREGQTLLLMKEIQNIAG